MSLTDWRIVYNAESQSNQAVSALKGDRLTAADFAYTPTDDPSTWNLRIDDARHVAGAFAALGKGFRGEKVTIPSRDLPGVRRRVENAWRKFHDGDPPLFNEERRYPWDYNEPGDEDEEDYDESGDVLRNQDDEEEDDDEPKPTGNQDEEEEGVTENGKRAIHQARLAMKASNKTHQHMGFSTDAYMSSYIADRVNNPESNLRAYESHDLAQMKHLEHAKDNPDDAPNHHKAAHHHGLAKSIHEESMTTNRNKPPTGNAVHTPLHDMNDDEFHEHRKAVIAEGNRRDMAGFMNLTYENPGNDTPSAVAGEAYEQQDPGKTDYMQEFEGLGLSHNEAQELRDLLRPTMSHNQQPSVIEQLFASKNPKDRPYQEAIRTSVQNANRERGYLLQQLTANMSEEQKAWAIQKYRDEPIEDLRRIVQAFAPPTLNSAPPPVAPDFGGPIFLGGSGGAAFTNNQAEPFTFNQQPTDNSEPLLPTQPTDWKELSEQNRHGAQGRTA